MSSAIPEGFDDSIKFLTNDSFPRLQALAPKFSETPSATFGKECNDYFEVMTEMAKQSLPPQSTKYQVSQRVDQAWKIVSGYVIDDICLRPHTDSSSLFRVMAKLEDIRKEFVRGLDGSDGGVSAAAIAAAAGGRGGASAAAIAAAAAGGDGGASAASADAPRENQVDRIVKSCEDRISEALKKSTTAVKSTELHKYIIKKYPTFEPLINKIIEQAEKDARETWGQITSGRNPPLTKSSPVSSAVVDRLKATGAKPNIGLISASPSSAPIKDESEYIQLLLYYHLYLQHLQHDFMRNGMREIIQRYYGLVSCHQFELEKRFEKCKQALEKARQFVESPSVQEWLDLPDADKKIVISGKEHAFIPGKARGPYSVGDLVGDKEELPKTRASASTANEESLRKNEESLRKIDKIDWYMKVNTPHNTAAQKLLDEFHKTEVVCMNCNWYDEAYALAQKLQKSGETDLQTWGLKLEKKLWLWEYLVVGHALARGLKESTGDILLNRIETWLKDPLARDPDHYWAYASWTYIPNRFPHPTAFRGLDLSGGGAAAAPAAGAGVAHGGGGGGGGANPPQSKRTAPPPPGSIQSTFAAGTGGGAAAAPAAGAGVAHGGGGGGDSQKQYNSQKQYIRTAPPPPPHGSTRSTSAPAAGGGAAAAAGIRQQDQVNPNDATPPRSAPPPPVPQPRRARDS